MIHHAVFPILALLLFQNIISYSQVALCCGPTDETVLMHNGKEEALVCISNMLEVI